MNNRRGLIRLWVFASAIWIALIVTVAIFDLKTHWGGPSQRQKPTVEAAEPENPYAKYVASPGAEAREPGGDWWKNDPVTSGAAPPEHDGMLLSAVWKYAALTTGVPIILLGFGAGVWWVVIGFKSDVPPRIMKPEPPSEPDVATRKQAHPNDTAPVPEPKAIGRMGHRKTSGWPMRRYVVPIAVLLVLPTAFGGDLGVALCIAWHMYAWRGIDLMTVRN
jgi:hypothetical protein